jgi:hypothetical protein
MNPTPVTRKDLPYLEVEAVEVGPLIPATEERPECAIWRIRGHISDPRVVVLGTWITLLGHERNCLYGNWLGAPSDDGQVVFETGNDPGSTVVGSRLTYAGQLDGRAAILIEDGPAAWGERIFAPRDAVVTRFIDSDGQGWRNLRELRDEETPELGTEIVKDGWDHEHCLLCNGHIDPEDRFFRHRQENEYLCVECYCKHVLSGDIGFLAVQNVNSDHSSEE